MTSPRSTHRADASTTRDNSSHWRNARIEKQKAGQPWADRLSPFTPAVRDRGRAEQMFWNYLIVTLT
jgi:uncharacterized protein YcaQ